jgi:hypothetical protein
MALGDIVLHKEGAFGSIGSRKYVVASGAAATINAGELVLKALGGAAVTVWTASNNAKPVAGTDFIGGLSASTSTDTATANGTVELIPLVQGQVFLGNPNTAASWDTQSEYDALVGDRVLLDTTAAGVQTILHTDGATYGLVIEPLDIAKYPGKVAFSIRAACAYNA